MTRMPLVSIGLPTYNRAQKLERAMEFVLAQDYPNIEVVISDNASSDETPQVCERLRQRDSRVRYVRQATNIGPTANYMAVLELSTGELYMALADDDWIDPDYVSKCVEALLASPDRILVCGRPRMYKDGAFSYDAAPTTLTEDSPSDRVVRYYRAVIENGAYHGIVRRDVLLKIPRMPNIMAGDWIWIAALAFRGKIETLETTGIIKHLGGATVSYERIASILKLPAWQARYWSEAILSAVVRDIAWHSPVYSSLGVVGRARLAARVAVALGIRWNILYRWRSYLGRSYVARLVRGT